MMFKGQSLDSRRHMLLVNILTSVRITHVHR